MSRPGIAKLWEADGDYPWGKGPFALYLDLTGISQRKFGKTIYTGGMLFQQDFEALVPAMREFYEADLPRTYHYIDALLKEVTE